MNKDQLYSIYFANSRGYFLNKLPEFKEGNRYTFNLPSFLLGGVYFFYRKMYKEGVILLILIYTEQILSLNIATTFNLTFMHDTGYNIFMTFLFATVSGFIFNRLYLAKAIKVIDNIQIQEDEEAKKYLRKQGGTSIVSALLLAVGMVIFTWLNATYFLF
ncbi:DUF2628 domain-containing protein [Roseivirga thermotolerans]|uniref:DUF2628 domain-containing protein n=1 Tax=Roseivirga thermotolerans TaxID=1758176 RepID=UPI0035169E94